MVLNILYYFCIFYMGLDELEKEFQRKCPKVTNLF